MSDCIEIACELWLLPNNTGSETLLHKSGVVRSVHWIFITGAVTGRILDVGQNVLRYVYQTGSSSSHSYCHNFFLIAFLDQAFIRNVIQLYYSLMIQYNYNLH